MFHRSRHLSDIERLSRQDSDSGITQGPVSRSGDPLSRIDQNRVRCHVWTRAGPILNHMSAGPRAQRVGGMRS